MAALSTLGAPCLIVAHLVMTADRIITDMKGNTGAVADIAGRSTINSQVPAGTSSGGFFVFGTLEMPDGAADAF